MNKQKIWEKIRDKISILLFLAILLLLVICGIRKRIEYVQAAELTPEQMIDTGEIYQVDCTAYDNQEGILTATGRPTVEGLTMAGAKEWLGCTCILYDEDMNFLGFYEFTDTGYGRDGDIERGETIDIYIENHEEAVSWGRRTVYIQIVRSEG